MQGSASSDSVRLLRKEMKGLLIITSLVGVKLILSFLVPGLKTPAELVWTGLILLGFTIKAVHTYNKTASS
jgi:hypothetical protein